MVDQSQVIVDTSYAAIEKNVARVAKKKVPDDTKVRTWSRRP